MSTRRVRRLGTTIFVVLALLFSQLALAGYICSEGSSPVRAPAMEMGAGEPCEGMAGMQMDQEQPVLCHQHCVNAPQSFDPVQAPALAPAAVVQVLVAPLVGEAASTGSASYALVREPRPPPDPLFLSTLRLRV